MMTSTNTTTPVSVQNLLEKFSGELSLIRGDKDSYLSGLGHPKTAGATDLVVLPDQEHIELANSGSSKYWVVSSKLKDQALSSNFPLVIMSCDNPKLMMAKIAQTYFRPKSHLAPLDGQLVADTAYIDTSAILGEESIVGPGAVIGRDCKIGNRVIIGANCVIEDGCVIGDNTQLYPLVFIGYGTQIGENCIIKSNSSIGGEGFGYGTDMKKGEHHKVTHYGKVVIGNHVHIGSGTHIDRGTFENSRIEDQVKIDNLCHFGHNIEIGRGTIVTGAVCVAGSVRIGKYCVIGGRSTINGHLEIGDHVHLGGLSGVTKSILEPGQYGGHPLQPLSEYLKTQSSLRKVPALRKTVQRILKSLAMKEVE